MLKKFSARLTCVVTAIALVVSVAAFFSLDKSLAWFAKNETVSSRGVSVSVTDYGISSTVQSFGVLELRDASYTFEQQLDASGELLQIYSLPIDDPESINYSKYSKALVVVLTVEVNDDKNVTVDLISKTNEINLSNNNYFSNCITVAPATYALSGGNHIATKSGETRSFVTVSGDSITKNTLQMRFFSGEVKASEPLTLYFVIEYNRAFLDYIKDYVLANNPGYSLINYMNDIQFVVSESEVE